MSNTTSRNNTEKKYNKSKPKDESSRRRTRNRRRPPSAKALVLFNHVLIDIILTELRKYSGIGPSDILRTRLVCNKWADAVFFLPKWVWRRWTNPRALYFINQRKVKICDDIHCRIMRIRESGSDWNCILPPRELTKSRVAPGNNALSVKCNHCYGDGSGSSPVCFHCPAMMLARHHKIHHKEMKKILNF